MPNDTELSERERDILRLVATGASNKEIAQKLVISPNTVKVHLRNIFAKIDVMSRTEATLYAIRAGLVEHPAAPENGGAATLAGGSEAIVPAPAPPTGLAAVWARLGRFRWLAAIALAVVALAGAGLLALALDGRLPAAPAAGGNNPVSATIPPRWQERAPLPEARSGLAAAVYDNEIYAIAGQTAQGVSGAVTRYDPAGNTWQTLASKPHPVTDVQAAQLGEKIYVPGGRLADGQPTNLLEVYDPRRDAWETRAPLPAARSAYALAALEGRLYLFGGWDGKGAVATVYEYDPASDAWDERTPLPSARMYAAATSAAGKIFVVGGYDGKAALKDTLAYYPERDGDGEDPWENLASLPEGRYGMGMASLADVLYLVGGKSAGALPPLQYSTQTDKWTAFESPIQSVGWDAALVGTENFIYALGGKQGETPAPVSQVQGYQALYTIAIPIQIR
jgi:DNA-binding CsgD family transcriptional regulator